MSSINIPTESWITIRSAIEDILNPKSSKMRELEQYLAGSGVRDLLFRDERKPEIRYDAPPAIVPSSERVFVDALSASCGSNSGTSSDEESKASTKSGGSMRGFEQFARYRASMKETINAIVSAEYPSLNGKERDAKCRDIAKSMWAALSKEKKREFVESLAK